MRIVIPPANWTTAPADAIENATDGDVIIVGNSAMKELGEDAHTRMRPHIKITFEVEVPPHQFQS